MTDSRHFQRIFFDCFVQFKSGDCNYICELVDISINGALIAACSGATPGPGTACELTISLDEDKEFKIVMQGTVTHKEENRVGIHCDAIDIDSMTNLRKLIQYNLDDPELINRDLDALGTYH